ncbi:hypothetical protein SUGI_0324350 [Cryptomeria japonica]|nr:hypothetical protein SUGI_0324350 [Cryptomeria japonica]
MILHAKGNHIEGGDLSLIRCQQFHLYTPTSSNVRLEYKENGDPLGHRELGKNIVKCISQGMLAMAADLCVVEELGEVAELAQTMSHDIAFVMQAQHFLTTNPMPKGLEALCLKASTHYPMLFDHFQQELRDGLQALEKKFIVQD